MSAHLEQGDQHRGAVGGGRRLQQRLLLGHLEGADHGKRRHQLGIGGLFHRLPIRLDAAQPDRLYSDGNVVMVWIEPTSGRSIPLPEAIREACQCE